MFKSINKYIKRLFWFFRLLLYEVEITFSKFKSLFSNLFIFIKYFMDSV